MANDRDCFSILLMPWQFRPQHAWRQRDQHESESPVQTKAFYHMSDESRRLIKGCSEEMCTSTRYCVHANRHLEFGGCTRIWRPQPCVPVCQLTLNAHAALSRLLPLGWSIKAAVLVVQVLAAVGAVPLQPSRRREPRPAAEKAEPEAGIVDGAVAHGGAHGEPRALAVSVGGGGDPGDGAAAGHLLDWRRDLGRVAAGAGAAGR